LLFLVNKAVGPALLERSLNLLRNLPARKSSYRKLHGSHLRALLRSLVLQTFSSYGFQYVKFLIRSVIVNFRLFPEAIGISVKGHHLFTITEDIHRADIFAVMLDRALKGLVNKMAAVPAHPGRDMARSLERHARHVVARVRRKYNRLADETRVYMKDQLRDFENQCAMMLSRLQPGLAGSR